MIAGSDCGFATFAGSKEVHPSIVWAKLQALTEGARMASKELWKKAGKNKSGEKESGPAGEEIAVLTPPAAPAPRASPRSARCRA